MLLLFILLYSLAFPAFLTKKFSNPVKHYILLLQALFDVQWKVSKT